MFARRASKKVGPGDLLADWEMATSRMLATRFHRKFPSLQSTFEVEDLEQEALIHWVKVRDQYRSDKGASEKTFMSNVVENRFLELLRSAGADMRRANSETESLSVPAGEDSDGPSRQDQLPDPTDKARLEDAVGIRMALEKVWNQCTPRQKKLIELLTSEYSLTDAANQLQIHRSTVDIERDRIRNVCVDAGLREFL